MKLKEMSDTEIQAELNKEFSQSQLNSVHEKLTGLIKTSETMEQLVARIYEAVNVEIEESQVHENKKINRLDTRKDIL
jgi:NADH pyrophosphatase NudC (nudix superfamily)